MNPLQLAAVSLLVTVSWANPAFGQTTWYVDGAGSAPGSGSLADPYTSIQYAIDQATTLEGDTIEVAPGTYCENVHFQGKPLTLVSSDGPESTTIQGCEVGDVVTMNTYPASYLDGFTVTGATGVESVGVTTGWGGDVYISRCIIRGNPRGVESLYDVHLSSSTVVDNDEGLFCAYHIAFAWTDNTIFWNNGEDLTGGGEIYPSYLSTGTDPMFWDEGGLDFRLRHGSPCIDSGSPHLTDDDGSRLDIGALVHDATYAPAPAVFCSTASNSVGSGSLISSQGSISIAANEFTLHSAGSPANKFGMFFYGPFEAQYPFGDGYVCVAPGGGIGLQRLKPPIVTDSNGDASQWLNFTANPADAGPGEILAGSTWCFQLWYRDPNGPGGTGFNFSDGLKASFLP